MKASKVAVVLIWSAMAIVGLVASVAIPDREWFYRIVAAVNVFNAVSSALEWGGK